MVHQSVSFPIVLAHTVIIHTTRINSVEHLARLVRNNTSARVRVILFEETRHQWIVLRIIRALAHIMFELVHIFLFTLSESKTKECVGPSLFSGLLFENILKKILVALY